MSNENSDISYNSDNIDNVDNSDTNNIDNVDNSDTNNIDNFNSEEIQLYDISYVPLIYIPNYNCTNILLIDSTVEDYQTIVDSVNSNTMAIVYSYLSTKEDLSMVLSNFTSISRIGFAFYSNDNNCPVIFLDNQPFFSFDLFHVDVDCENILFLKKIFQKYNVQHVDYLACNTLNYWQWNTYYTILMENTNTIIAASNNETGNIKYGGDWVLESNSEDIEQIYFTDNIQYYNYLLDNAIWLVTTTNSNTAGMITMFDSTLNTNIMFVSSGYNFWGFGCNFDPPTGGSNNWNNGTEFGITASPFVYGMTVYTSAFSNTATNKNFVIAALSNNYIGYYYNFVMNQNTATTTQSLGGSISANTTWLNTGGQLSRTTNLAIYNNRLFYSLATGSIGSALITDAVIPTIATNNITYITTTLLGSSASLYPIGITIDASGLLYAALGNITTAPTTGLIRVVNVAAAPSLLYTISLTTANITSWGNPYSLIWISNTLYIGTTIGRASTSTAGNILFCNTTSRVAATVSNTLRTFQTATKCIGSMSITGNNLYAASLNSPSTTISQYQIAISSREDDLRWLVTTSNSKTAGMITMFNSTLNTNIMFVSSGYNFWGFGCNFDPPTSGTNKWNNGTEFGITASPFVYGMTVYTSTFSNTATNKNFVIAALSNNYIGYYYNFALNQNQATTTQSLGGTIVANTTWFATGATMSTTTNLALYNNRLFYSLPNGNIGSALITDAATPTIATNNITYITTTLLGSSASLYPIGITTDVNGYLYAALGNITAAPTTGLIRVVNVADAPSLAYTISLTAANITTWGNPYALLWNSNNLYIGTTFKTANTATSGNILYCNTASGVQATVTSTLYGYKTSTYSISSMSITGNFLYTVSLNAPAGTTTSTVSKYRINVVVIPPTPIVNIGTNPTRILYKVGYTKIDICNNFTSINLVTTPLYNGSPFFTGYFCYHNGSKYDLSQLYNINTTLISTPLYITNIFTTYNGSKYDLNSFFNPNISVSSSSFGNYSITNAFTLSTINTPGAGLYYLSSLNGTNVNNPVTATFTIINTIAVKILLVGGGGNGGNTVNSPGGNGGGQGGNAVYAELTLSPATYTITIDGGSAPNAIYGQGGSNITFSGNGITFQGTGGGGGQNGHSPGYSANPSNELTSPTTTLAGATSFYYARGSNGQSANSFAQSGYVIVPKNATIAGVTQTTNTWYFATGNSLGQTTSYLTYSNYYSISYQLIQDNYYYLPIDVNMFNDMSGNTKTYNRFHQIGFGAGGTDALNFPGHSRTNGFVYAGNQNSAPTSATAYQAGGVNNYSVGCGGWGASGSIPNGKGGPAIAYIYFPP